jgi:hypothetical protein
LARNIATTDAYAASRRQRKKPGAANDTSWCGDGDTLWVKLVADETDAGRCGFRGGVRINVSREGLGG